jgi:hypothetical protein
VRNSIVDCTSCGLVGALTRTARRFPEGGGPAHPPRVDCQALTGRLSRGAELFLSIIVIIWRIRPTLKSSPRIHVLGREKHIITRSAQLRTVASQAGSDPIDVRNVGPAEAKSVRCAGLSLLVRPLSDRRRSVKQERKRCDPAGDWMLWPHTGALGKNCFHRSSRSFLPAKMSNSGHAGA